MATVLWGANRDDIQFGSDADLRQAEKMREWHRQMHLMARYVAEAQAAFGRMGVSIVDANQKLAKFKRRHRKAA